MNPALVDRMDHLDQEEIKVSLEDLVLLVLLDPWDQQVPREVKEPEASLDLQDRWVSKVVLDHLDQVGQ